MKMDWHRLFLFVNYTLSTARTNTTGAFSPLASGDDLDAEWGPTSGDARHRIGGSINVNPIDQPLGVVERQLPDGDAVQHHDGPRRQRRRRVQRPAGRHVAQLRARLGQLRPRRPAVVRDGASARPGRRAAEAAARRWSWPSGRAAGAAARWRPGSAAGPPTSGSASTSTCRRRTSSIAPTTRATAAC